jgi:protein TonB
MSNVSIFEKKWIDLVFEGKNKAYGAYQLRQENPKTTIKALFSALLLIAALSSLGMLFSAFAEKPIVAPPLPTDVIITVTNANFLKKEEPKKVIVPFKKDEPKDVIDKKELIDPKIVSGKENHDDIATNKEIKETSPINNGNETGTGIIAIISGTPDGTEKTAIVNEDTNEPNALSELDKLPDFPGGIKKFYEYVGNNFEKPELDNVATIRVLMSFVIEKDGSMTDIKVVRNPGYGLDKEAIRVLKSLRTKWSAGMKNGKKVRTQYTLPILVKME